MKAQAIVLPLVTVAGLVVVPGVRAQAQKPPTPTSWCYVAAGVVDVRAKPSDRKTGIAHLGRGALVPGFEVKQKGAKSWTRIRAVDPATLTPRIGWVESRQVETLPLDQFPKDTDLLKQLGGAYLDDFTAAKTAVARFLLRQGNQEPALVCFLGSPILPHARLQVFLRSQGKLVPGPFREFVFAEMQGGMTDLEVRDLLGDGNECLLTREPFTHGPENRGVNLVIQRIEGDTLKTLWKAPIEFRNLASFPPRRQLLEPPESNIGAPGTVTKATVDFRPRGLVNEPFWKGKVESYVFGREEPVETVPFEKICAWDGTKFAPLR